MKVQIIRIGEKDSYADDEGFVGAIGTMNARDYNNNGYSGGLIKFDKKIKVVFMPEGERVRLERAYFHQVMVKPVE